MVCMYVCMYVTVCMWLYVCDCIYIYIYIYYLCLWTIWTDVKLLIFQSSKAGGSGGSLGTATNEDTHLIWWYRLGRLVNGNRLSQEPACRFSNSFQNQTWCQGGNDLVQMEMLHLAAALKYIPLDPSWIWSSTFSLSSINGLFSHVGCIPHQNSQRFSVWFMLDSSRWHEPRGECLSEQEGEATTWSLNLQFST